MKRNLLGISMLTLAGLYFLLSLIIIFVCVVANIPLYLGLLAAIIVVIIQFIISPWITDITMKWFYKAKFDYKVPDYLEKYINETCKQNNMKYPKIGFIDDGSPNAFSYGHTKNDARIVVTRGIFELLSEEEAKAVVAHELGHATHYDMLFMTVASLVPLILYFIYQVTIKDNSSSSSNDNNNSNAIQIAGIIAFVLYIISEYIVLWLSRTREYYADEFAIKTTKNPEALGNALVKIGFGLITNKDKNENKKEKKHSTDSIGALGLFDSKTSKSLIVMTNNDKDDKQGIKNAMKWEMWNPWAKFYELNSTHPLISKRLLNIASYSKEYHQKEFIVFDEKKPESYIDDFLIELLIKALPFITLIIGCISAFIIKDNYLLIGGITGIILTISIYIGFKRAHKDGYEKTNVKNLLNEVKVSAVTSISCTLEGEIIGRGDPGYIFNEDFMIKDETGIIYIDYKTPLWILNKLFAFLKNNKNLGKNVILRGWYRRSPVPYVEVYDFIIEGKKHKTGMYTTCMVLQALLLISSIVLIILNFII